MEGTLLRLLYSNKIDEKILLSDSWDVITCNIKIDVQRLTKWYNFVKENYNNLKFSFDVKEVLKEEYTKKDSRYGYNNVLEGKIYSWTLDWPVEKDIPIPPIFAANLKLFPELNDDLPFKLQHRYKFGYFENICNILGENVFCRSRITVHDTGAKIKKHIDDSQALRLHIPIVSNNKSKFLFGENLEREYSFKAGSVYIINASIPHATVNNGPTRVHIISDPGLDKIAELLKVNLNV